MDLSYQKILFIQHTSEVGGSLRSLLLLIEELQRRKKNLDVLVICRSKHVAKWYEEKGIKTLFFPSIELFGHSAGSEYSLFSFLDWCKILKKLWFMPKSILRLKKLFDSLPHSVVHLNSSVLLSCAIAAKLSQKKLVWHIREILSSGNWGVRQRLLSFFIKTLADKVVTISPSEAKALRRKKRKNVTIVPNFLPQEEDFVESKALSCSGEFVILSMGGMNLIKGAKELLLSLQALVVKQKIRLIFIGDLALLDKQGHFQGNWKEAFLHSKKYRYCKELSKILKDYPHQVDLVGPTKDVRSYLKKADALYFGGTKPHFSRPIFEAWAHKIPPVAFKMPGVEEFVLNGKNGILVPMKDVQALQEAFVKLIDNPEWGKELAQKGYETGAPFFNRERSMKRMEKVYEELSLESVPR